ncbi:MAG: M15 family metallopeptidase [Candidatus Taylorbacteria bacterium]|nr:M15 family metallopeptidase [Candidatus Taylorbacteria bacterium]
MKNYQIWIIRIVSLILIIGGIIWYGEYRRNPVVTQVTEVERRLASTTEILTTRIHEMSESITGLQRLNTDLSNTLQDEQTKNSMFEEKISKVSDTVGTINKLSTIDPELLQKYSKIFFLNEHYTPSALTEINAEYRFPRDKKLQIHEKVNPYLERMFAAAAADKSPLQVVSAYRSFSDQTTLKATYKIIYGAGTANQFSADQGYSEHQLGTTVDLTTPKLGSSFDDGFENTPAYTWLVNNAHKYGFVLSYPKNNKYYQYEPWHWRFVGVDLAEKLHRENKFFYDLDQRVIDHYLLVLFD